MSVIRDIEAAIACTDHSFSREERSCRVRHLHLAVEQHGTERIPFQVLQGFGEYDVAQGAVHERMCMDIFDRGHDDLAEADAVFESTYRYVTDGLGNRNLLKICAAFELVHLHLCLLLGDLICRSGPTCRILYDHARTLEQYAVYGFVLFVVRRDIYLLQIRGGSEGGLTECFYRRGQIRLCQGAPFEDMVAEVVQPFVQYGRTQIRLPELALLYAHER